MEEIVKNLLELRFDIGIIDLEMPEKELHRRKCNHAAYVIRSGEKLEGEDREFVAENPQVFLEGNDDYKIIKVNNLKYEVYIGTKQRCRFFKEIHASEYVMFLMELI